MGGFVAYRMAERAGQRHSEVLAAQRLLQELATMTLSEELVRLESLHQRGALSDQEFQQAKQRLLEGSPSIHSDAAAVHASRWRRSTTDRWLGGVCGGLAPMLGVESWMLRLLFTLVFLLAGAGLLLYALLWFFVPLEDASAPVPPQRRLA
jgi:phage shock protein PspC (stress-responsive transcriptional regulator)